jgi:small nuclear ribonucleoprotein (snRNP)-like protein
MFLKSKRIVDRATACIVAGWKARRGVAVGRIRPTYAREGSGMRTRVIHGESHNEYFFTIEEAWHGGNPNEGAGGNRMLEEFLHRRVVIDLRGEFVCLGTLQSIDAHFLELRNADLHDLRDTDTTRENYVAACLATGVKRNRRRLLLVRSEIVAIALFDDVVET